MIGFFPIQTVCKPLRVFPKGQAIKSKKYGDVIKKIQIFMSYLIAFADDLVIMDKSKELLIYGRNNNKI